MSKRDEQTFKAKHVNRMTAIVNTAQNLIDYATDDPTFFIALDELLTKKGYQLQLIQQGIRGTVVRLEKV